ncbi:MAG: hypothetical protein RXO24_10915 [Acidilobus sp.]
MGAEYSAVTPVALLSVSVTGTGIAQAVWSYTPRTLTDIQSVVNAMQSNNPSLLSEPSDLPYVPVPYYARQVSATRVAAFLDNPVVNYGMDRPVAAATATAPYGLWSTNFVTQVSNNQGTIVSPYGAAGGGGGRGNGEGGEVLMFGDKVTAGVVGGTGGYNPGNAGGGRGGDGIALIFYCPRGLNGTKSLDPAAGPGGVPASGPSVLAGQTGVYLATSVIVNSDSMSQPTVLLLDPETGEWVTQGEHQKKLERRRQAQEIAAQLRGAVIQFALTGIIGGTTATLAGAGAIVAVGTGGGEPGWQTSDADPERRDYYKLSELSERVERFNNQLVSLRERVARLEENNRWLKRRLKELNRRTRYMWRRAADILTLLSAILTILFELLKILSRLPVAH